MRTRRDAALGFFARTPSVRYYTPQLGFCFVPFQCRAALTWLPSASQTPGMHNSFLVFDFGADEAAAQQARHKLEGWKQAFRLDKKLLYKFERDPGSESGGSADPEKSSSEKPAAKPAKAARGKGAAAKPASKAKSSEAPGAPGDGTAAPSRDIKLLVRLYFSGHEKLSHQRWIDRIPNEEPFKNAKPETVRQSDAAFAEVTEKFEALN
jgi:hypothetical protein